MLALGKIKTEPKKQKKKKPKVKVEVEIPKVDNKKRKRKNTDNIDDIAKIKKKKWMKAKRVVYPTGTWLALGKIKTNKTFIRRTNKRKQ